MRHLLRIQDLGADGLDEILDIAHELVEHPDRHHGTLCGRSVVLYFAKPSPRTRISFETAVHRLGGLPVTVGPADLQLGRGETVEDTARVVGAYAAAFVVRTFADDDVRRFAAASTVPVVNALTDGHHPCQALADMLTLRDRFGDLRGRRLAFVGDGDNVAHSLLEAGTLLGMEVAVASPVGFGPDPAVVTVARANAAASGGGVVVTDDPAVAVRGASAVYTDVWVSMGVPETERATRTRTLRPYQVDSGLMAAARPDAVFMHCLPAHRGEEVTAEVIDGPQSVVFDQAALRLPTEQAVLYALVEGVLDRPAVWAPAHGDLPVSA